MNLTNYHARRADILDPDDDLEGDVWPTRQRGAASRFTADEIERIRRIYDAQADLRRQRNALCRELGIDRGTFGKYGRRESGKKPRNAPPKPETIDWVAQHPRPE